MTGEIIFYAVLGGILPALIWLGFWLREDYKHPEPKGLIIRTFLLGMGAVVVVLPLEKGVDLLFPGFAAAAIILWAAIEEIFKLAAAYIGGLHSREDNEPLDPLVYTITAALGFVALENTLFVLGPLVGEEVTRSIVAGNLRFIGASLLHVVCSGFVGAALAFSFYKSEKTHVNWGLLALAGAIILHAAFNLSILFLGSPGALIAFTSVWILVILLLWTFEKAKSIAPPDGGRI